MRLRFTPLVLAVVAVIAAAAPAPAAYAEAPTGGFDDSLCRPSRVHSDPIVFLHGIGANKDLGFGLADMATWTSEQGYCAFGITYGAHPAFPTVGGLRPVAESAAEIKDFILRILDRTGAEKVDIVGHSEGGFQALYVPKTQGIADKIDTVIAIAPPTHSHKTTYGAMLEQAFQLGARDVVQQALTVVGAPAAYDMMPGGGGSTELHNGPVTQPGVRYVIITSLHDQLIAPPQEVSFLQEPGVTNRLVQEVCPEDTAGHAGEALDPNIWRMVANELDPAHAETFECVPALPF